MRVLWQFIACTLGFLAIGASGCNLPPADVWMFVDNSGAEPLAVSVDGQTATTVAPGRFEIVKCPPGEHRIEVRRGDEIVFEEKKELKPCEQFGMTRKFVLNPVGEARYAIYIAQYGHNPFKGSMQAAIAATMENPPSETELAYYDLLKQVKPLAPERFLDVGTTAYVLTDPPDHVITRSGGSSQATVLTRVKSEVHQQLMAARDNQRPTRKDVEELEELCDQVRFAEQGE